MEPNPPTHISNFGRNVQFIPNQYYCPQTEADILEILRHHCQSKIRVMGAKHSWSPLIETEEALVHLTHFDQIRVSQSEGQTWVTVGGGCQIKTILQALAQQDLTLPSVGLITEQTIAGAIATGTHGSGKHCLSHYVRSLKLACFDASGTTPQIVELSEGIDLQGAQCSLGCIGIIVEVTLPCIPQYYVEEKSTACDTIDEVLALEPHSPLQQFFLIPHLWSYFVQERRVASHHRRQGHAWLYRIYWFLTIDIGLHLMLKLFAAGLKNHKLVKVLYQHLLPAMLFQNWVVVDRSDRQLVMENELFSHLEMEVFMQRSDLKDALDYVVDVLKLADDAAHALKPHHQSTLESLGLLEMVHGLRGCYSHHYPICCRRIMPDNTLLSMTSGGSEDWYSISFITYTQPRDNFYKLTSILTNCLFLLYGARLHWGKWFPLKREQVQSQYPQIETFRELCQRYDPNGVFQNTFVKEKLDLTDHGS